MFKQVLFEERNGYLYIYLNNPPANQISFEFLNEFEIGLNEHLSGQLPKGIIIAGKGRHFSSGTDTDRLKQEILNAARQRPGDYTLLTRFTGMLNKLYEIEVPLIGSINGLCIGSGLEIALHTHIRVVGKGSVLSSPESTFGLLPGLGGTLRCLEIMGSSKALEWILSGDTFSAEEAYEEGIATCLVSKKENLSYCEELLEYLASEQVNYDKENARAYVEAFELHRNQ